MKLNEIRDNQGARKNPIRVGRGIGSGKGKTAGRGVKGQKARSGHKITGFEGGQMPIYRRLPKRGFYNTNALSFAEINLDGLQKAVDAGKIEAGKSYTAQDLAAAGVIRRAKDGLRVLGRGEIKAKLTLEIAGGSKSAIAKIEKAGGKVVVLAPAKEKAEKNPTAKSKPAADTSSDAQEEKSDT